MNVHLESGVANAETRYRQLTQIMSEEKIFDYAANALMLDVVLLAGDFNFRLLRKNANYDGKGGAKSLPAEVCDLENPDSTLAFRKYINENYQQLFDDFDQYSCDPRRPFFPVSECPVRFPPTYRFYRGYTDYDNARVPAWTDRVFFGGKGVMSVVEDAAIPKTKGEVDADVPSSSEGEDGGESSRELQSKTREQRSM